MLIRIGTMLAALLALAATAPAAAQSCGGGGECVRLDDEEGRTRGFGCVDGNPEDRWECRASTTTCRFIPCPDPVTLDQLGRPVGLAKGTCGRVATKPSLNPWKLAGRPLPPSDGPRQRVSSPASRTNSLPVT